MIMTTATNGMRFSDPVESRSPPMQFRIREDATPRRVGFYPVPPRDEHDDVDGFLADFDAEAADLLKDDSPATLGLFNLFQKSIFKLLERSRQKFGHAVDQIKADNSERDARISALENKIGALNNKNRALELENVGLVRSIDDMRTRTRVDLDEKIAAAVTAKTVELVARLHAAEMELRTTTKIAESLRERSRGEVGPQGYRGERGERGERGVQGPQGERGRPGKDGVDFSLAIKGWKVDRLAYTITPAMSDGSDGPALDLKPLLQQFLDDTGEVP
jgi:hypothetical protein